MATCNYTVRENTKVGTHSFYVAPVFKDTLTSKDLLDEALAGTSIEPEVALAAIGLYMKAIKRNVLRGNRCQLGDDFLTVYPNLSLSVKDELNQDGSVKKAATAEMLNISGAKSRLGCTVSKKFSQEFATQVSWRKAVEGTTEEGEDITQGNENTENSGTTTNPSSGDDSGNGFG